MTHASSSRGIRLVEHAGDEPLRRLDALRPRQGVGHRVERLAIEDRARVHLLLRRPDRVGGDHRHLVDQDQLAEALPAVQLPVPPDDRASHRVPGQGHVGEVPRGEELVHVLGQPMDAIAVVGLARFAVAAHVDGDDVVACRSALRSAP